MLPIISAYNEPNLLQSCVAQALAHTSDQVLIIDNSTNLESMKQISYMLPDPRILYFKPIGWSHGDVFNWAIGCFTEPLLFLDQDCLLLEKIEVPRCDLAGELWPAFIDPLIKMPTAPRFHSSFVYVNPLKARGIDCRDQVIDGVRYDTGALLFKNIENRQYLEQKSYFHGWCDSSGVYLKGLPDDVKDYSKRAKQAIEHLRLSEFPELSKKFKELRQKYIQI